MSTEEVSIGVAAGCAMWVEGDEVEICRFCTAEATIGWVGRFLLVVDVEVGDDEVDVAAGDRAEGIVEGSCVCMRVLTTSRGQVIVPAIPPAVMPVNISSGNPISFDPTHHFANSRSFS